MQFWNNTNHAKASVICYDDAGGGVIFFLDSCLTIDLIRVVSRKRVKKKAKERKNAVLKEIFSFKYVSASLLFVWAMANKASADKTEFETKK